MPPLKPGISGPGRPDLDRRAALKALAGGLSLPLVGCSKPYEEIVPYVDVPERMVPGDPLYFATTLPLAGYGRGVIVKSIDGRPLKIEGNPRHPASLGATDLFAEAEIMTLYDPDRSKAPRKNATIVSWDAISSLLQKQMVEEKQRQGGGLRLVTGRITSPTLLRQIDNLLKQYPAARWHRYEAIHNDAASEGARLAFGRPLDAIPGFDKAAVIVSLGSDFLGAGPSQIVSARTFAKARSDNHARLYAVEPAWSLTGANADHRLALHPTLIRNVALRIAAKLGVTAVNADLPERAASFVEAMANDLVSNRGRAIVLAGPAQDAEVHALCHWINAQLHAPIDLIPPVDPHVQTHADSLMALARDLHGGAVKTLIVIGANPAYDTPGRLNLAEAIRAIPFSVHAGLYADETAAQTQWHVPLSHALESWSDLRACNGTAGIVQPLIRPLYESRGAHEILSLLAGDDAASDYDTVRQSWRNGHGDGFDDWWRQALHDGVIPDSAPSPVPTPAQPNPPQIKPAGTTQTPCLVIAPDPSVWDGTYANNAWLQECPEPLTKAVWGNYFDLSPHDAKSLELSEGDIVELTGVDGSVHGPARIRPEQADGVISTTLGHGRTHAGAVGNAIGFDINPLRPSNLGWRVDNVTPIKSSNSQKVLSLQQHFTLKGKAEDLFPGITLAALSNGKRPPNHAYLDHPTLNPVRQDDTYAWAMVIDTSACIGCNACVVACQIENNVPIVGPEEIARGRDMHWLRVDHYTVGENVRSGFQPVPCMHCEHAPCEPVCPVEASVHDAEGLNVQVYNRCIGTRFCQANCPYKVRRFNWFGYADGQEYADLGDASMKDARNPDVTVRARGVMEKCTYCIQRISRARRTAETDHRAIADGEVVTACQAACPTRAITFGDKNNPKSEVSKLKSEQRHYALLGDLGTRPRTTYLAQVRNPNPTLTEDST
jgi:molybdopterin-containing oxidoreductase family iron-sulfur binding subunit